MTELLWYLKKYWRVEYCKGSIFLPVTHLWIRDSHCFRILLRSIPRKLHFVNLCVVKLRISQELPVWRPPHCPAWCEHLLWDCLGKESKRNHLLYKHTDGRVWRCYLPSYTQSGTPLRISFFFPLWVTCTASAVTLSFKKMLKSET